MVSQMRPETETIAIVRPARTRPWTLTRALLLATCLSAPLFAAGCKTDLGSDITGSIPSNGARPGDDDESLRRNAEALGKRYASSPNDKSVAIPYARALRLRGQYGQAVAVLQGIAIKNPKDKEVLGAYGKALADAGRLEEAADVLPRAHSPDQPDWSILSAQGSVADRMGDHAAARDYYLAALKIMPNEPSVLSNLGLSYTLSRQLPQAEQALRQAAASPRADTRVRQNLALVLSLEGKYTEAEQLGERDLSPEQSAANVNAIRKMSAQSDTWRDLRALDAKKLAAGKPPMKPNKTIAARPTPDIGQPRPATAAAIDDGN